MFGVFQEIDHVFPFARKFYYFNQVYLPWEYKWVVYLQASYYKAEWSRIKNEKSYHDTDKLEN